MTAKSACGCAPRGSLSFRGALAALAAKGCGIDPDLAAAAGEAALPALQALRKAMNTPPGRERDAHLLDVYTETRSIDRDKYDELVARIRSVLKGLQNTGVKRRARVNPRTGQQEFAPNTASPSVLPEELKRQNSVRERKGWEYPYHVCNEGMMSEQCENWIPHFKRDKPWFYVPTEAELQAMPDNQKEWYGQWYRTLANVSNVPAMFSRPLGHVFNRNVGRLARVLGGAGRGSFEEIADAYENAMSNRGEQ